VSAASAKPLFCVWLALTGALAFVPATTAAETDSELLKSFRIAAIQPRHNGGPDRAGANGADDLPFEPGDYVDVTIEAVSQNSDVAFDHHKVSLYAKDQLMPNAAGWPQYRPAEGDPRFGILTFKLQRDRGSDESKRA
jgi:hypothetical protein